MVCQQLVDGRRRDKRPTARRDDSQRWAVKRRIALIDKLLRIRCVPEPQATFYCWATLRDLPAPFNDAMTFFRRALDRKVMTVPGEFFDVNPGKRRPGPSPYRDWMRFSFGPPMDNMVMGLERLAEMLDGA